MNDYSKLNKVSLEIRNQVEEREHFHQDIELIYVLDGAMTVEVGNQKSELKAEDILVINANKKHWLRTNDKDILYLRLGIAYQLVSDVFQSVDIIFWCDSSKENDKRYEEVRKVLKELLGQYLKGGQTEVSFGYISLCYKVLDIMALHFLVQTGDKENITDKDRFEDRILQINNYIRSNYAQNISLKDLSEKLYLSIGYLSRFFKKNYGMSFAEYLTNIRLYHAVEDLLYTNVPITHVAYDNGFTNAAVFNKAFKKAYGETPSSFRKKAINENGKIEHKGYDKETEQRILNILEDGVEETVLEEESENIEIRESVKTEEKIRPIWNKMINIGSAGDLLRSEIREHVILLKEAIGIEYIRFWNMFSENMLLSLSAKGNYNFSRLDSILDFLLQNDIKPHIELLILTSYFFRNIQQSKKCQKVIIKKYKFRKYRDKKNNTIKTKENLLIKRETSRKGDNGKMKLGFITAICDGMTFEEVVDFAAENGLECLEVACWPQGGAQRRYAGVSHIDVANLTQEKADEIKAYCKKKGVEISSLAYYPNTLEPNLEKRQSYIDHLYKLMDASVMLDVNMITTFVGRDPKKSVSENLEIVKEVWPPIVKYAEEKGVKIGIENCPMLFTEDEWPGGQNLMTSPANWRKVFEIIDSPNFGINYDPSHFVWQQIDYIKPIYEFKDKIFHVHYKDIKVFKDKLADVGTMATPLEYMSPKLPGLGDVDWGKYVSALTDIGYDGYTCIEVEDKAFEKSLDDAKKAVILSAKYLRNFVI